MTKVQPLTGIYTRSGIFFSNNSTGTDLMICQRSAKNLHKQPYFLLQKLPDNSRRYISSLYQAPGIEAVYYFDYDGIKYQLNLIDQGVEILEGQK